MSRISTKRALAAMARVGYAARGLVFLIIGGLALFAAAGAGTHPQGARDALQTLFEQPLGGVIVSVVAAGLLCFAGWRLLQSVFDADRHGNSPYALLRRAGFAGSGLFYLALAVAAARIPFAAGGPSENQSARLWSQWLMAKPFGRWLLAGIGLAFIGMAFGLAVKVIRAPYERRLEARIVTREWAVALGSFGIATRAFVFLMIGGFLEYAVYDIDSTKVVGLSGAFRTLQQQSYGAILLTVAALGFVAFGFFEMLEAAARRVRTPKSLNI